MRMLVTNHGNLDIVLLPLLLFHSTVINADRILVFAAGRVVESGTHHHLLAHGGLYRDYHQKQFASAETN